LSVINRIYFSHLSKSILPNFSPSALSIKRIDQVKKEKKVNLVSSDKASLSWMEKEVEPEIIEWTGDVVAVVQEGGDKIYGRA
jgi:cellobiose phosphorylase